MEELNSEEIWNQAEKEVDKSLEQAIPVIPVRKIRLSVGRARQQFLLMAKLILYRNEIMKKVRTRMTKLTFESVD